MDQSANHACLPTPLASTTGRGQDHEMPVEETSTPQKLPQFRYHPDPVGTGSIVADEVSCVSCEQRRPYTYTGPVYAEEELNEAIFLGVSQMAVRRVASMPRSPTPCGRCPTTFQRT